MKQVKNAYERKKAKFIQWQKRGKLEFSEFLNENQLEFNLQNNKNDISLNMSFKEKVKSKGLKTSWLADQIDVNYNSLRVYLNDESKMPMEVQERLKYFLK